MFYRGGWCPFCNFQVRELAIRHLDLERRGVRPVAVSVDRPQASASTRELHEIPFPALSDPDLAAHEAYRVLHRADDAEVEMLEQFGMDIRAASGRDHHGMAIPSLFVIDGHGIVRWAHADRDYKTRPSIQQLLDVLDGLTLIET